MKFLKRMKFVLRFWRSLPFVKDFFISREVHLSKKLISIALIFGYAFFPYDVIPDFLFVVGIVDDAVIVSLIIERMVKWAPKELIEKYQLDRKI
ncbi:YkvA family protein [Anaerobacillus sp. MEB173]|uniref:YkvA family protein n=1 Tax=Anaerobacillus sp. MEB173 TaxID=3383345 RepID=UPI003F8FF58E